MRLVWEVEHSARNALNLQSSKGRKSMAVDQAIIQSSLDGQLGRAPLRDEIDRVPPKVM